MLTEQEFRVRCDDALEGARAALLPLADAEDFEVELQQGLLHVVFETPIAAKFIVSPNAPVRQVWVSAMSRSFKLPWDAARGAFALDGETLDALLQRMVQTFLGGGA